MIIKNCLFACNLAEENGGAIKSENTKNIEIYSSVFSDNTATISGGAIYTSYVIMVELNAYLKIIMPVIQVGQFIFMKTLVLMQSMKIVRY